MSLGLARQLAVDGVQPFFPVPLVGFKLPLLVVIELKPQLPVAKLLCGVGDPFLLFFKNGAHGLGFLVGALCSATTASPASSRPRFSR